MLNFPLKPDQRFFFPPSLSLLLVSLHPLIRSIKVFRISYYLAGNLEQNFTEVQWWTVTKLVYKCHQNLNGNTRKENGRKFLSSFINTHEHIEHSLMFLNSALLPYYDDISYFTDEIIVGSQRYKLSSNHGLGTGFK